MNNIIITALITAILLSTEYAYAGFTTSENNSVYGGIGTGITHSDISSNDTETHLTLKGFTGFNFTENWSLELGGIWFDTINKDGQDAVSQYDINIERYDIYMAPAFQFKPRHFIPIRLMAGISHSKIELEVKESFYRLARGGKTSIDDSGTSTYISVGIVPFQSRHLSGLVSIDYIKRPDFFEQSTRPFSITDTAINFRLSFN